MDAPVIRMDRPLRPVPAPSLRPWAGRRLGSAADPVGELWLAGPGSLVESATGPVTLDAIAATEGAAFIGERAARFLGARFPLIVKLIDAADWLSLQVHPDDALAAELYGPSALGKAEAWLVLDAEPDALLVTGPRLGLAASDLRAAIGSGTLGRDGCDLRPAIPGETLMLEAGTLHAIGAGTFVYEIEQPSDITFRISDWGRPPVSGRVLHRDESLRAVRPDAHAIPAGRDWRLDGGALTVPGFRLEIERLPGPVFRRPAGLSLEIVTTVGGTAQVAGDGWREELRTWETLVVPASVAEYRIDGPAGTMACVGSIPAA